MKEKETSLIKGLILLYLMKEGILPMLLKEN